MGPYGRPVPDPLVRRTWVTGLILVSLAMGGAGCQNASAYEPGARSAADPLSPGVGNGGYDVSHYGLDLRYTPSTGVLSGTATISMTATQDLSSFSLDLRGMRVSAVRVGGVAAAFEHPRGKLIVTPATGIDRAAGFTVAITYSGKPGPLLTRGGDTGWLHTSRGALALGEQEGADTWFPANDRPGDKARFDVSMSVPNGLTAISNGLLARGVPAAETGGAGYRRWTWHQDLPQATYVVAMVIGKFDYKPSEITLDTEGGGTQTLPLYNFVDSTFSPRQKAAIGRMLRTQRAILDRFIARFGDWPFSSVGAIVVRTPRLGDDDSMETQGIPTLPVPAGSSQTPSWSTFAHEYAHQWFGDAVTPGAWADLFLNEGWARFGEIYNAELAGPPFDLPSLKPSGSWRVPPGRPPGPDDLFTDSVYDRSARGLEVLRHAVGDATFFKIAHDWIAQNRYGNATHADFLDLVARDVAGSGRGAAFDVPRWFSHWFYDRGKP
ncbi:MAG: hypothetical protein QOG62_1437 [Thermoleophilaceae bacterium]|nr:hypothetical protein [Thermoleophilaceae bacterium]